MRKEAIMDPTGKYRYSLTREWADDAPRVVFVMLNPSTADDSIDDPTIRRCIDFARRWGYGSLEVVNLFAYRATDPGELKKVKDPVGQDNDMYIAMAAKIARTVIVAWGAHGVFLWRDVRVMELLKRHGVQPLCLGTTADGQPRHPLYLAKDTGQGHGTHPVQTGEPGH